MCWVRRRRMKRRKRLNNITSMSLKLKSNLDLKTQVQIIGMPQTYLGRKWYRSLRKTDVENEKLFDVNDLPEADQKWKKSRKYQDMHAQRKINCLRDSFIIPMWNLNCTRRRHTQSDPPKIMLNKSQNICVEWKEGGWRRRTLNNITSMSLKLKSNLDLKTQVQIIEMPQT